MGEIGVAVVVPRDPDAPPTLDQLRTFGATRLSAHKLPEALRLVDDLPLTPMQKVDRRTLAAHEGSRDQRAVRRVGPVGPVATGGTGAGQASADS